MGEITATYLNLTGKGASTSPDDPFVAQAERVLNRLGRASGLNARTIPGCMKAATSYAQTVAQRMGANFWDNQDNKETEDSLFGLGPLLQNTQASKTRLPRLRETTLVRPDEDSVSLHEVQRELSAF
jgi:hypothetical protein